MLREFIRGRCRPGGVGEKFVAALGHVVCLFGEWYIDEAGFGGDDFGVRAAARGATR